MGIGSTVMELRKERGLSRERLAAAANTSSSTIDRLELHGQVPKLRILTAIAAALDVPVTRLIQAGEPEAAQS